MTIPDSTQPSLRDVLRRRLQLVAAVLALFLPGLATATPPAPSDRSPVTSAHEPLSPEKSVEGTADGGGLPEHTAEPSEVSPPPPSEVRWTVLKDASTRAIAESWGMRTHTLVSLNDGLEREGTVPAGTSLVVYRYDPEHPARSLERPNDGRLRNGVPLPEGTSWLSQSHRFQYGTARTVNTLLTVFEAYGATYPDAQKIRVGDLSRRKGGEIGRKHNSHQSGRDADLGYIGLEDSDSPDWVLVTPETLDLEKTWFLIDSLIATGHVQVFFIDADLQRALRSYVMETFPDRYTPEELAMLFEFPRREHSHRALIQHWDHHADHMHIRFKCEPGNWRCRGRGEWGVE